MRSKLRRKVLDVLPTNAQDFAIGDSSAQEFWPMISSGDCAVKLISAQRFAICKAGGLFQMFGHQIVHS